MTKASRCGVELSLAHRDREAFQEFGIKTWLDTGAKRVMVLDHADRASEIVAEAIFAAQAAGQVR